MRRGVDCSRTLKALLSPRHWSERRHGTLEGAPGNKLDGSTERFGIASRSLELCDSTQRKSRQKTDNGTQGMVGTLQKRKRLDSTGRTCAGRNPRALGRAEAPLGANRVPSHRGDRRARQHCMPPRLPPRAARRRVGIRQLPQRRPRCLAGW